MIRNRPQESIQRSQIQDPLRQPRINVRELALCLIAHTVVPQIATCTGSMVLTCGSSVANSTEICQTTTVASLINMPLSAIVYSCLQNRNLTQERARNEHNSNCNELFQLNLSENERYMFGAISAACFPISSSLRYYILPVTAMPMSTYAL